jgi:hypothetical protein
MAAFKSHVVASLLNNCLENISRNLTVHEDLFEILPVDIKSKLTKKLSMRGLLRDWHLQKVCRSDDPLGLGPLIALLCLHFF